MVPLQYQFNNGTRGSPAEMYQEIYVKETLELLREYYSAHGSELLGDIHIEKPMGTYT